jgi:hypothetical protein
MQGTNLFEPLSIAANQVPAELDQATAGVEAALQMLDDFDDLVTADQQQLDGQIAEVRDAVARFGQGCQGLNASVEHALEQLVAQLSVSRSPTANSRRSRPPYLRRRRHAARPSPSRRRRSPERAAPCRSG